ncbi:MAG: SARP family transcriptional regulator [Pseudonocardia sp.]|nr:MAG: SARP family transcriptional regulator [Pseudonocardia sp.]
MSGAVAGGSPVDLVLTGEFDLVVKGRSFPIPHTTERIVAYLALAGRPVARCRLAGTLWPNNAAERAAKNLRSSLWRLHALGANLIIAHDDRLRLCETVSVDVDALTALAQGIIQNLDSPALEQLPRLLDVVDVLPDWDDDWVVIDRERFRLTRLEALECASGALVRDGRLAEAQFAAQAAVRSDPLRETARRLLAQIQIARGNVADAICGYREYRLLLGEEFGVAPSIEMDRIFESLGVVTER